MSEDLDPIAGGWSAELLRVTAFPHPRATLDAESWWRDIVGDPPDRVVREPKKGEVQIQGAFNNDLLIMNAQVMRIELRQVVNRSQQPPNVPGTPPLYEDVRSAFRELAVKWLDLDTCPPLLRLAFGAVLTKPVEDSAAGSEVLKRYLPAIQLAPDSSDFLYQINRRRPSNVIDGLVINRLSKWSMQQSLDMFVRGDGLVARGTSEFACRTELDVNSNPERTDALPADRLVALFNELVALADELSTAGDVP